MASLVADYGTDSGNDTESDENDALAGREEPSTVHPKTTNFFAEEESSSSGDDERGEETETAPGDVSSAARLPNPLAADGSNRLPDPNSISFTGAQAKHSVFVNAYKKAEDAKLSVLEQHVKMTSAELEENKTKKRICMNFMKGKCRFGKKCKYRHPKDLNNAAQTESQTANDTEGHGSRGKGHGTHHNYYGHQSYHGNQVCEEPDDDSYMGQAKRKYRAGINDKLQPNNKAMKNLNEQRSKERPWTM